MELKLIKTFVTVARTGSFSESATILRYAQSSVSDQIKKLEQSLSTILFDRVGSSIKLTNDGEIFLGYSERILNLCEEAVDSLSVNKGRAIEGKLRIAITESLCFYKLSKLLEEYHIHYPKVDIEIKLGSCYDFPDWIRKNMIDIVFVLDNTIKYPDIKGHVLFDEPLSIVVSSGNNLADKEEITAEELINEKIILTQKGSKYRAIFETYLEHHLVEPSYNYTEFESVEAIKHFVLSNLGISFLPLSVVEDELESGTMKAIKLVDKEFNISAQMIYHQKKWVSPALKAMIDLATNISEDIE